MVFAALDYWQAQVRPPVSQPAPGTPLYQFIVRRLIDSWHIPAGVAEYYQWMNLPDGDASLTIFGRSVVSQRGLSLADDRRSSGRRSEPVSTLASRPRSAW